MTDSIYTGDAAGCLLGQAIGDMMGLPAENLSRRRMARLFPNLDRPRFFFGRGMGSDDTEHACMTAHALLQSNGDPDRFRRSLAWRLRWWFLCGPPGIGLATLKACLKLWLGFPSTKSGVFSAGNGPAMRAAILGVVAGDDAVLRRNWVRESTRLTHTDPKAEYGALAVATLAYLASRSCGGAAPAPADLQKELDPHLPEGKAANEFRGLFAKVASGVRDNLSVEGFADALGLTRGVSGYIYHTVPVAVFAFFRHPNDYRAAVEAVIRCGGDTDTVAAIAGAMVGARVGKKGIPTEWLAGYRDWPWTVWRMELLGRNVAMPFGGLSSPANDPRWEWDLLLSPLLVPVRNFVFFLIVLGHIARRTLPPYG
ncbi:ADP-ribosylglycohydrolase family protein [Fimbriiglobus ruber]|uniref:Putative dinitrogenase reductase activating glycohydrolase (DraG) n=1 Tax=Fimbriiglobus ruber TaxID=1908690 RepID=A0A225DAS1_9BACT|nr:ADP-ribosylglycohydrolase family protein [Fimbriiglobus ruber]OWK36754.1 putative dinitrogenase reductase activating glycohydrolase (draG) [Fimbriiglobus ruber]